MTTRRPEEITVSLAEALMAIHYGLEHPTPDAAKLAKRLARRFDHDTQARLKAAAARLSPEQQIWWAWLLTPPPEAPERVPDAPIILGGQFVAAVTLRWGRRLDPWGAKLHWLPRHNARWDIRANPQGALCGHVNRMRPVRYAERPRPICRTCDAVVRKALLAPTWDGRQG